MSADYLFGFSILDEHQIIQLICIRKYLILKAVCCKLRATISPLSTSEIHQIFHASKFNACVLIKKLHKFFFNNQNIRKIFSCCLCSTIKKKSEVLAMILKLDISMLLHCTCWETHKSNFPVYIFFNLYTSALLSAKTVDKIWPVSEQCSLSTHIRSSQSVNHERKVEVQN